MNNLSHFDEQGASRMVDVSGKSPTLRSATAMADVVMAPVTADRLRQRDFAKGDVLEVARLAGIMAAKRTGELIPLCHPLGLDSAAVDFEFTAPQRLRITARVSLQARTGVEMEALTAASIAALTVYDMCKAMDRGMTIQNVQLLEKTGGRSGDFRREVPPGD